jgi:hypothetical protein
VDAMKIQEQIYENRKSVAFDSYDIAIRQLYDLAADLTTSTRLIKSKSSFLSCI